MRCLDWEGCAGSPIQSDLYNRLSGNQGDAWWAARVALYSSSFRFEYTRGPSYTGDAAVAQVGLSCAVASPPFFWSINYSSRLNDRINISLIVFEGNRFCGKLSCPFFKRNFATSNCSGSGKQDEKGGKNWDNPIEVHYNTFAGSVNLSHWGERSSRSYVFCQNVTNLALGITT